MPENLVTLESQLERLSMMAADLKRKSTAYMVLGNALLTEEFAQKADILLDICDKIPKSMTDDLNELVTLLGGDNEAGNDENDSN